MRSGYATTISAPSAALLRFLRSQSQEICFFSSSSGLNTYHQSLNTGQTRSRRKDGDGIPSYSTDFEACRQLGATCESSILNFDFFNHGPTPNDQISSTFWAGSHRGILKSSARHGNASKVRQVSTEFRPLLRRLWGSRHRFGGASLKPDDLPERPSFLDDVSGAVLGRSKLAKASNEMKLRCTELDENGKVTVVNGEFKKSELIAKVSIRAAVS